MKIAVINEGSTKMKNPEVCAALRALGHEVVNLGMTGREGEPDLNYLHTALLSALCLHLNMAEFVVGGCGTGQGYMNAVLQFPDIFCGLLLDPVDALLFRQVNAGNCVSLALNKGYALGGDLNLKILFEQLFGGPFGNGYPEARKAVQKAARDGLAGLSRDAHKTMAEIVRNMNQEVLAHVLRYPGVAEAIRRAEPSAAQGTALKAELIKKLEA